MPFTVGTTTTETATRLMHQRKIFYANGRWWVFYGNGTDIVYRTSVDGGSTWTDETIARSGVGLGYAFSVHFDGTYCHFAFAAAGNLFYRRGTPNADGTITYSADWQTAESVAGGDYCYEPAITVDTNGYPWIAYIFHNDAAGTDTPYITKSSTNDGTWATDVALGFPIQLSATSDDENRPIPVALTAGKVYIVYGAPNETVKGKLYDGGMGAEEEATSTTCVYGNKSVCAFGDDVHLLFEAWVDAASDKLTYVKRTDSTWGAETDIRDGDATFSLRGTIGVDDDQRLYVVSHLGSSLQVHRLWTSWSTTHTYTETQVSLGVPVITMGQHRHLMGFLWTAGEASPYNIRFNAVGVPRPETAVAPTTL